MIWTTGKPQSAGQYITTVMLKNGYRALVPVSVTKDYMRAWSDADDALLKLGAEVVAYIKLPPVYQGKV